MQRCLLKIQTLKFQINAENASVQISKVKITKLEIPKPELTRALTGKHFVLVGEPEQRNREILELAGRFPSGIWTLRQATLGSINRLGS